MSVENIRIDISFTGKKGLEQGTKALEDLNSANQDAQKEVEETNKKLEKQGKTAKETSKGFKTLGDEINEQISGMNVLGVNVGKTTSKIGGLTKGFKGLRLAIAATGIGALLIALTSLITFFTKTQRGADALSKATAALGATMDVLVDRVSLFGEKIFNAFQNPQQAVKDLGTAIQNFFLRRIQEIVRGVQGIGQAFSFLIEGEFKKALEAAGNAALDLSTGLNPVAGALRDSADAFSDVVEEIERESAAAARLQGQLNALRDKEIAFIKTRAELRQEIAAARLEAEEEQRVNETLAEANQRRFEALQRGIEATNKLSEQEIALAQERATIMKEQVDLGESMADDFEELAQAEATVIDLQTQRDETLKRLITRQNAFNATVKDGTKEEKERAKQEKENITARLRNIADVQDRDREASFKREQLLLSEREALRAQRDWILENEELTQEERLLIIEDFAQQEKAIREQAAQQQVQLGVSTAQSVFDTFLAFSQLRIARLQQQQAEELEAAEGNEARQAAIRERFEQRIREEQRRSARIQRASNVFQATVNSFVGYTAALTIPVVGQFLAPIILGLGLAQAAAIAATPIPEFEEGGRIGGKRHSDGGTLIEAELGEHVMNRKATRKYGHDIFDRMNALDLDPNVLSGQTGGVAVVPVSVDLRNAQSTNINIDEEGFTIRQQRNNQILERKARRYSSR